MIRMTSVPRPVRVGAAMAGVAGMLALAGCATDSTAADEGTSESSSSTSTDSTTTSPSTSTDDSSSDTSSTSTYADGTYTADGTYQTPQSTETISVTITLEDDIITAVEVTGDPTTNESTQYQSKFISGISAEVVGQDIDEISVSRVSGSSLTSTGFNAAVEEIKAEAEA